MNQVNSWLISVENTSQQAEEGNQDAKKKEEDENSEEENNERSNQDGTAFPAAASSSGPKQLPKFELSEFYNLNVAPDVKDLLSIMQKYITKFNLDTMLLKQSLIPR